ncbi:MAG: hypothetical protein H7Y38_12940 [Armatimonadetes bacterium]|nr:hypothetical protein [Armatimonadota bacterium]
MTLPLYSDFSDGGQTDFDAAIDYLTFSIDALYAERFTERLGEIISALVVRVAQEIASNGKPFDPTHEGASLRFSRPVHRETLRMGKTRTRRNSSGLWYVYYALEDRNGADKADTLVIVAVRHSAAAPFDIRVSENGAP